MTLDFSRLTPEQEYALTAFINTSMILVDSWCSEGRPQRIKDWDTDLFRVLDILSGVLP